MPAGDNRELLRVCELKKHFPTGRSVLKAVDGVSLEVPRGSSFGLVGESGSGKTTLGRTIVGLYKPTAGQIYYDGRDLGEARRKDGLKLRRRIQMVFQNPRSSLDARMKVSAIVGEGLDIHGLTSDRTSRRDRVAELLTSVGLAPGHGERYPHELSGGQRQRVGLARALAVQPELIVADEPVSALDVSMQAQMISLMSDLQKDNGLSYLFISHDLSVVRLVCDRIAVMYLGQLVEVADTEELYTNPLHPYTEALLSAIPRADPDVEDGRKRIVLGGELPDPVNPPSGCRFRTRCPRVTDRCGSEEPEWREGRPGHWVSACSCIG